MSENKEVQYWSFDLEANGLIHTAHSPITKIWIMAFINVYTKEMFNFHDYPEFCNTTTIVDGIPRTVPHRNGSLLDGARFFYKVLKQGDKVNCHNILGYDLSVLHMFYPKIKELVDSTSTLKPWEVLEDTFIMSKNQHYDRATPLGCKGNHGLESWGVRQGIKKPVINDWSTMDAPKIIRCLDDIEIQRRTYLALLEERKKICKGAFAKDFEECYKVDAEYQWEGTKQSANGALVDVPHMQRCLVDLDKKLETLAEHIEPRLPPSLVVKVPKISKKELHFKCFGFYHPKIKEESTNVIVDGVAVMENGRPKMSIRKDFYQPHTVFTTSKVHRLYGAVSEDLGINSEFEFEKQKDARSWVAERYTDKKDQKTFKYPYKEVAKELYNHHACNHFEGLNPEDYGTDKGYVVGTHTRISFEITRMTQHAEVKDFLLGLGWKPTEWNYKKIPGSNQEERVKEPRTVTIGDIEIYVPKGGKIPTSPKLTEDSFDSLPEGVGRDIADYNTYMHRRRFIENTKKPYKGLMNNIRLDGRINAGLNVFSTATGRSVQTLWVNAPGEGKLYGEEIRGIIIAPEGKSLVSADQKSAQLSIAAYYANNEAYYKAVADGQEYDPKTGLYIGQSGHCVNVRVFGLVSEAEWRKAIETQDKDLLKSISLRRKGSKGGTFAAIFGASGKKVAWTLGISEKEGEAAKNKFLAEIGLEDVIEKLKYQALQNKYLRGGFIEIPFNYRVWCQQEHKLLNYIDQGTEAACQKVALNYVCEEINRRGIPDAIKILDVHDEATFECRDQDVEEVGSILSEGYKYASDQCFEWHLKNSDWFKPTFAFNLDAGYKSGKSYWEVH